jgi:hypothetical protein
MNQIPPDRAPTLIDTPIPAVKISPHELLVLVGRYRAICDAALREFRGMNAAQKEVLRKMERLALSYTKEIPVVMP